MSEQRMERSTDRESSATRAMRNSVAAHPRRIWIIILLGLLFGPLAQVYCGRLTRAFCLLIIEWLLAILFFFISCYLLSGLFTILILAIALGGWSFFIPIDAAIIAHRSKEVDLKKYQRTWCYFLIGGGIVCLNFAFCFSLNRVMVEDFIISTRSMSLTLVPGDRISVDKMVYRFMPVKRGDVVAFYFNGPLSDIHAHRVIGLPGDVVEIRDENLYLNGILQKEPYARFVGEKVPLSSLAKLFDFGPATVPEGHFFEMGDNRRCSIDSRMRGCIPLRDIVGKVQVIYWSSGCESPDADPDPNRMPPQIPETKKNVIRWDRIGNRIE
jgi:signal peptidase I